MPAMESYRLPLGAAVDLAHLGTNCLFILGRWIGTPSHVEQATIELDGASIDVSSNFITFSDDTATAAIFRFLVICICQAKPRTKARALLVLVLSDGTEVRCDASISRKSEPFETQLKSHYQPVRRLLLGVNRLDYYRLEAELWPETANREEVDQLTDLGSDLALAIDFCCVPIPNMLLVVASLADPFEQIVAIDLFHGEGDVPFARKLFPYDLAGAMGAAFMRGNPPTGLVIFAEFDEAEVIDEDFVLLLATKSAIWTKSLKPRLRLDRGLNVLAVHLQGSSSNINQLIFEQLSKTLATRNDHGENASRLPILQAQAIADLPDMLELPDRGAQFRVDAAYRTGTAGLLLTGWALIDRIFVESITINGSHTETDRFLDHWVRDERADVWQSLHEAGQIIADYRLGFICFAPVAIPNGQIHAYATISWRDGISARIKITLAAPKSNPMAEIEPILRSFEQTHPDLRRLLDQHVGPAIRAIWSERRKLVTTPDIRSFGSQAASPDVSMIIPIYGRFDFIEFQIAKFVDDPNIRCQDIIYVLDDPLVFEAVLSLCQEVSAFYEVPFRLVCAGRRMGFAAATNLGASLARGRVLLLLNSDVLPIQEGWLLELCAAYRALPRAGAVAPRLIYEDGSTQHEGMRFVRHKPWGDMWVNDHPNKGQHGDSLEAPLENDSLTGACLLLDRSLFLAVGGLCEDYIVGDFEDSDLCLKLLVAGYRNWLVPSIVLYHLERQSQDRNETPQLRGNLTLLNCWIHNERWNAEISRRIERLCRVS
jgi:GT2 family glycosyltransferase